MPKGYLSHPTRTLPAEDARRTMRGEDLEVLVAHDPEGELMAPYEGLLGDALDGDRGLFAREDGIEAAWSIVDADAAPSEYEPETWGLSKLSG